MNRAYLHVSQEIYEQKWGLMLETLPISRVIEVKTTLFGYSILIEAEGLPDRKEPPIVTAWVSIENGETRFVAWDLVRLASPGNDG